MRTPKAPLFLLPVVLAACAADGPTAPPAGRVDLTSAAVFPGVLALPNGFAADGITFGPGTTFYVGSLTTGAVWRGDALSGAGAVLVQPQDGRSVCGITYDPGTNRLFVAGSATGQVYVYDAATGATLAVYQVADPAAGATNLLDIVVLHDGVYVTDNERPVLYRIPLGTNGALPPASAVQVLPYSGDLQGVVGSTGMVATADQRWLLITNMNTGMLSRVDPATGQAMTINLGGGSLPLSDGLALIGQKLYVSLVANSQVGVVDLSSDFSSGVIEAQPLTNPALDFQSKIATFGNAVYAVNAHFELDPAPDVAYQVVRVSR